VFGVGGRVRHSSRSGLRLPLLAAFLGASPTLAALVHEDFVEPLPTHVIRPLLVVLLHPFSAAFGNAQSPEGVLPLFDPKENINFWNIQRGSSKFNCMFRHKLAPLLAKS
jgi:hypothetical protein